MLLRPRIDRSRRFLAQFLALVLITLVFTQAALAADIEWVRQFGNGDAMATDADGNTYVGGSASSSASPFLRKYDPSGKDLWTRPFCGFGFGQATEVMVSGTSVFIAGSSSSIHALVCRYDTSGNLVWSREFGTAAQDIAESVSASSSTVFVAGHTYGAFAGQTRTGVRDAFIRAYDLNGTELWTRQFGAPPSGDTVATAVVSDAGAVYVVGQTTGVLPGQTGIGGTDAFIRKYDVSGAELWTRQFGTAASEGEVWGAAGDNSGIYVTGTTYGGTFQGQTSAGGASDAFIRKYTSGGDVAWTRQFGTSYSDWATSVTTGTTGVYVAGQTESVLPGQTSVGEQDAFVRKYDGGGNEVWTRQFGTASGDFAREVAVAGDAVYVSGFAIGTFPGQTTAAGPFVAKLRVALPANLPPTANAGGPYSVQEGGTVSLTGSGTDPEGGALTLSWDLNGDGTFETAGQTVTFSAARLDGPATKTAALRACDSAGLCSNATAAVNVSNVAPVVGVVEEPATRVVAGKPVAVRSTFTDAGALDTHTATWNWGDGSTSPGTVVEPNGTAPGAVSGNHSYSSPGVYVVRVDVKDKDGASGASTLENLVVVNPQGGFVTGGGWIDSPAAAYAPNSSLSGKANFGFNVRYEKSGTLAGQFEFHFEPAKMKFQGTSYEWLVVAGAKAQCNGSGTMNGTGDYGFLLTVLDGDVSAGARGGSDAFGLKIWDKGTKAVVYDNQMGAGENSSPASSIGGGSIAVHAR